MFLQIIVMIMIPWPGIWVPWRPHLQVPIPDRKRDGDNGWVQPRGKAVSSSVLQVVVLVVEMMVAGFGRRLEEEFVDGLLLKCRTQKQHMRWG